MSNKRKVMAVILFIVVLVGLNFMFINSKKVTEETTHHNIVTYVIYNSGDVERIENPNNTVFWVVPAVDEYGRVMGLKITFDACDETAIKHLPEQIVVEGDLQCK